MPEAYSTTNTKHAAAISALGFPIEIHLDAEVINDNFSGKQMTQFCFQNESVYRPNETLDSMRQTWAAGKLPAMHPLLIGLNSCHNFELLREHQRNGRRLRLVPFDGSQRFEYRDGEELPQLRMPATCVQMGDMNLAAAMGVIGFPVVDISGPHGEHLYTLPQFGHPRKIGNVFQTEDAAVLIKRCIPGRLPLVLEDTHPNHPLCIAYNAVHHWAQLRNIVHKRQRTLILRWPTRTHRMAVISEHACDRVLDAVTAHYRLPV